MHGTVPLVILKWSLQKTPSARRFTTLPYKRQGVRENWGDRGRGPERLNDPDYDRGQRRAIMDWSHEQNHRLAVDQQRAMRQELTREVHEYGITY
jgi:hypothetical protein